ncbi:g6141 [Coccomyxa elongata]
MSELLEADFRSHNLHSAYRRLGMRDELERTQPLGAGLVRTPEGGFARTDADRNNTQRNYFSHLLNWASAYSIYLAKYLR